MFSLSLVVDKSVLLIGAPLDGQLREEDANKPLNELVGYDPYVPNEADPLKSNALTSSLWEIQV